MPVIKQDARECIIGVMGPTGSGKSTFVNLISGSKLAVGVGLESCTSKVQVANTFELSGKLVTLVDTPGFDDSRMSDTDVLKMIAVYLSLTYQNGYKLSGLIYMHRISDFRVGGISRRNFSMFRKLCGDETLRNVVIVTNMWSEVTPQRGAARELELKTSDILFKPILDKGATLVRHDNTLGSAQAILRKIIDNQPKVLRIQRELVDEHKDVAATAAGQELNRELTDMQKKHKAELAEIKKETEAALAEKDMEAKEELERARQELLKKITKIENDKERLSREYAAERARADAKIKEIERALQAAKKAHEEKRKEIERLAKQIEGTKVQNSQEVQRMKQQLERMRRELDEDGGGCFGGFGGIFG